MVRKIIHQVPLVGKFSYRDTGRLLAEASCCNVGVVRAIYEVIREGWFESERASTVEGRVQA